MGNEQAPAEPVPLLGRSGSEDSALTRPAHHGSPHVGPGARRSLHEDIMVGDEKLFSDLLDDLDNISHKHTDSARRRKKARDLFSDWLFSEDARSPPRSHPHCVLRRKPGEVQRRRSADQLGADERSRDLYARWRPKSFEYLSEDDADSGYHTGSSTLQGGSGSPRPKPPGEYTLTREQLRRNIETFNNNHHGLIMTLQQESNTFQGFIRVHMNLIRPINMSLSVRPPSIYEVLSHEEPEENLGDDTQIASFYLPKDTTKVIHINSATTTQEVIRALLTKFRITDNPRKFALYEKVEEPGKKPSMRKLSEDELPLPLCLSWTCDQQGGLDKFKFVLQENDAGEILWEAFSIPELENFLKMLDKEEAEYIHQLRDKYHIMKIHMTRRLKEIARTRDAKKDAADKKDSANKDSANKDTTDSGPQTSAPSAAGEGKREPVFV